MTTIVAMRSRRIMVADTRIVDGSTVYHTDKLVKLNDGSVVGTSGDANLGEMFVDFLVHPKVKHWVDYNDYIMFSGDNKDNQFDALRLWPDGELWHYGKSFRYYNVVMDDVYGIGSGGAMATLLVRLGYDPQDAIRLVSTVGADSGTGPESTILEV